MTRVFVSCPPARASIDRSQGRQKKKYYRRRAGKHEQVCFFGYGNCVKPEMAVCFSHFAMLVSVIIGISRQECITIIV